MNKYEITVQFRAKNQGGYVKLVSPKKYSHYTCDNIIPESFVHSAWVVIFGSSGKVPLDHPLVQSVTGSDYMPTVTVRLPNVRTVVKYRREVYPALKNEFLAAGHGLLDAEELALEKLIAELS